MREGILEVPKKIFLATLGTTPAVITEAYKKYPGFNLGFNLHTLTFLLTAGHTVTENEQRLVTGSAGRVRSGSESNLRYAG
ncbi:MAG: hypothetical protein ACPLRH_03765 [Desulfotomaculales bacterium]